MTRIALADLEQQPQPIRDWADHRGNLNVFRLLANAPNVFPGWSQMVDELYASPTFSARVPVRSRLTEPATNSTLPAAACVSWVNARKNVAASTGPARRVRCSVFMRCLALRSCAERR